MKKLLGALLLCNLIHTALACTAVEVKAKDGSIVAGRTMEWAYDMDWRLLFYPAGTSYQLTAPSSVKLQPLVYKSKYAVLGIGTGLANDSMLEGQNSAGVGLSGNFLPGFTEYQTVTAKDKKYLSILEFSHFILSNFGSVSEIKEALPKFKVWGVQLSNLPVEPTIHFMITDKTGANIVVEFIDGQMKIFDKTVGVMTNSPNYDWHMTNIRNYLNLDNSGVSARTSKLGNVTSFGQGGGAVGLPGDFTPPSRFVKTTFLANYTNQAVNAQDAVNEVGHILNDVDIPKGVVASTANGKQISDYTQWVAIKDLNNQKLYFSDYDHRLNFIAISLPQLVKGNKYINFSISKLTYPENDITSLISK